MAFHSEYGSMPVEGDTDTTILTSEDTALLKVLLGMDETRNPRGIRFLSVKEGQGNKDGLIYTDGGDDIVGLFYPWGGGYHIRLDLDGDGNVSVDGEVMEGRRVFVWSAGADQITGTQDDVKTW